MLEAVRTPFARHGGAFREGRPDTLSAHALKSLVGRAGIDPEQIEDVGSDTVTRTGEQGANVGRLDMMLADFPVTIPAVVALNRTCGPSRTHSRLEHLCRPSSAFLTID